MQKCNSKHNQILNKYALWADLKEEGEKKNTFNWF